MQLGGKLEEARKNAGLTLKEAAQKAGVPEKRLLQWESGSRFPELTDAVKLSEVYATSLDLWLKEEEGPSEYSRYLQKRSDAAEKKNRMTAVIMIGIYVTVWCIALLAYWLLSGPSDAMGYSLVFDILVLPLTTILVNLFLGASYGPKMWWMIPVSGVMYMLAVYLTFSLENMILIRHFVMPQWMLMGAGVLIALVAMAAGVLIRWLRRNRE